MSLLFALWCTQAPITMDHVLLEWGGGNTVLLARIKDIQGCWLCSTELRRKLCSSVARQTWFDRIKKGQ